MPSHSVANSIRRSKTWEDFKAYYVSPYALTPEQKERKRQDGIQAYKQWLARKEEEENEMKKRRYDKEDAFERWKSMKERETQRQQTEMKREQQRLEEEKILKTEHMKVVEEAYEAWVDRKCEEERQLWEKWRRKWREEGRKREAKKNI